MSGKTQISLSDFGDCDQSKKENNSISQRCCDFDNIIFDFDYDSDIQLKNFTSFDVKIIATNIHPILLPKKINKKDVNFYTNLPPPSGYDLLKVVQVFRI